MGVAGKAGGNWAVYHGNQEDIVVVYYHEATSVYAMADGTAATGRPAVPWAEGD